MHIIVAPDSYKDSLSARKAVSAIANGIRKAIPSAQWDECPMGDGGEGTLDALIMATEAERRCETVSDSLGRPRLAEWGWHFVSRTAYIELAEACGLQHLTPMERTAMHSCTYGVGELILTALDAGAERIILMLGGSATNDAGAGMLRALGVRFLDDKGRPLPPGGAALSHLDRIDLDDFDSRLSKVIVETAVDVDNSLVGDRGASVVFGPQKGASEEDIVILLSLIHI